MLIVTGTMELKADGIADAKAAAITMMAETRKEPGCRIYEFSQLLESETTFRVYEEWDDADALRAHGQTPHMAVFRTALGEAGVVGREIWTIEAGQKAPLG